MEYTADKSIRGNTRTVNLQEIIDKNPNDFTFGFFNISLLT